MKLTDLIFEKKGFLPAEDCEAWKDWFWHNTRFHEEGAVGVVKLIHNTKNVHRYIP